MNPEQALARKAWKQRQKARREELQSRSPILWITDDPYANFGVGLTDAARQQLLLHLSRHAPQYTPERAVTGFATLQARDYGMPPEDDCSIWFDLSTGKRLMIQISLSRSILYAWIADESRGMEKPMTFYHPDGGQPLALSGMILDDPGKSGFRHIGDIEALSAAVN